MFRTTRTRATRNAGPSGCNLNTGRLIIGLVIAAFAIFSYLGSSEYNPITGEDQRLTLTPQQEIALGQEAVQQLIAEYGGLHSDQGFRACFQAVGERIVQMSAASDTPWQFQFYLLNDSQTVNAFALPGGPVFITDALFSRLENEAQLAGILGHEIGHVVARHSAQRIAQSQLTQGILGAILTASGSYDAAQVAAIIGQLINMQYGRDDELQSDTLGVRFMADAGYDPRELIGVMQILADATGGSRQPEFFSTHPNPDNRIQEIQEEINAVFPNGVPDNVRTDSVVCG